MYYIPIYLKCGIYVGYFSFYDFMWDTCGIVIFIVRIFMWDKCGIGEKSKSFLDLWDKCGIHITTVEMKMWEECGICTPCSKT